MNEKIIYDDNKKIVAKVHKDGCVTEGTGNKIIGRVHEDGCITEGTSRRIAGRIEEDTVDVPHSGGSSLGALVVVLIFGYLLYFGIFKLPGSIEGTFKNLDDIDNFVNAVSLVLMWICMGVASLIANKCCASFFGGLFCSYVASSIVGAIYLLIENNVLNRNISGFYLILYAPLGGILFAALPALIVTCVYAIFRFLFNFK